jgi:uncharacterized protein YcnI
LRGKASLPALVVVAALALPASSYAHAIVSPPVVENGPLQVFTLSVPTEKEGKTTTQLELTVPSGFSIDSFAPPPAPWKMHQQTTGNGENAVVQKVTWTGGSTPTGIDSVFQFNASTSGSKTYTFNVRQTYSDGEVVDWTGPESSDTPAPTIKAVSSLGGGSSNSTLAIVALIVAGIALVLAVVGLAWRGDRPLA